MRCECRESPAHVEGLRLRGSPPTFTLVGRGVPREAERAQLASEAVPEKNQPDSEKPIYLMLPECGH